MSLNLSNKVTILDISFIKINKLVLQLWEIEQFYNYLILLYILQWLLINVQFSYVNNVHDQLQTMVIEH